jgi:hypothetical protein
MTDEPASIAGRLTVAQREAFKSPRTTHIRSITGAACRCALQRKGLVVNHMYSEELTPLGMAVRAVLIGEQP